MTWERNVTWEGIVTWVSGKGCMGRGKATWDVVTQGVLAI